MAKSLTDIKLNKHKRRNRAAAAVWLTFSLIGAAFILFGTTPDSVGPLGITLFFVLVFIALLSLGTLLRLWLMHSTDSRGQLTVILVAAATTAGLAIGTIELQIGDIILLALFVFTFSVYWSRLR